MRVRAAFRSVAVPYVACGCRGRGHVVRSSVECRGVLRESKGSRHLAKQRYVRDYPLVSSYLLDVHSLGY